MANLLPVAVAMVVAIAMLAANRGAAGGGTLAESFTALTGLRNAPRNAISFLGYQAMCGPVLLYWVLTRGRWAFLGVAVVVTAGIGLSLLPPENLRQYAVPAAVGLCFIAAFVNMVRQVRHAWP